jgi:hypothetical protein
MKNDIKIKNQSIYEWKNWIENELTPPFSDATTDEVKYVMEAFLELINIELKNKK